MSWDDGSHVKVKKVEITFDDDVIYSIQVTYNGTALQSQRRGSVGPKPAEFILASDEYITALSAYGKTLSTQEVITALTFTTNKRTLGPYGKKTGYQISAPEATGKQIAGFLGTSGNVLNSIDVHYAPIPTGSVPDDNGSESGPQKLDAQGGTGGTAWDDGSNYDGVTKIYVRYGLEIQFVKFDYVKDGQTKQGAQHGVQGRGSTKEIVINHPSEYLVSVDGWYDSSNVILGIQFKTNLTSNQTSEYIGIDYESGGTKFTLQVKDKKIVGFHGFAGTSLNSIGAYFVPLSSTTGPPTTPVKKENAVGGDTRAEWDDGNHDDVKKVYVGQGVDGISAVKFEYKNGSEVVFGVERGESSRLGFEEFELQPDEYLTSVEGKYESIYGVDGGVILTMLIFTTNKNNTSGQLGVDSGTPFVFKEEGYKITGFHGRANKVINAIGVYLAPVGTIPLTPATPSQKLEGFGSNGGSLWDDGAFDGVREVSVGQATDGIGAVKFVYGKGSEVVVGNEHGKSSLLGFEGFKLDYPNEYIIAVDGTYDLIYGNSSAIINMLRFKTNKATYGPFGLEAGTAFELKKDGHKIVGFHGGAGDLLHKFGVHVLPISK